MNMPAEHLTLFWLSDEIVKLADDRDKMTRSDLQGAAGALARKIYEAGKAAGRQAVEQIEETDPDACSNPGGHEFVSTGTADGGDDERWMGEGRCFCIHCGADGDA